MVLHGVVTPPGWSYLLLAPSFPGLNIKIVSLSLMPTKHMHKSSLQPRKTVQVSVYSQWFFSGPLRTQHSHTWEETFFTAWREMGLLQAKVILYEYPLKMLMPIRQMQGASWRVMLASTFRKTVSKLESYFALFHARISQENSDSAL